MVPSDSCHYLAYSIPQEKGDALFFFNMNLDGSTDPFSLHGSCPTTAGQKYSLTKWIHVYPYKTYALLLIVSPPVFTRYLRVIRTGKLICLGNGQSCRIFRSLAKAGMQGTMGLKFLPPPLSTSASVLTSTRTARRGHIVVAVALSPFYDPVSIVSSSPFEPGLIGD
jgi:hypothetical protein